MGNIRICEILFLSFHLSPGVSISSDAASSVMLVGCRRCDDSLPSPHVFLCGEVLHSKYTIKRSAPPVSEIGARVNSEIHLHLL